MTSKTRWKLLAVLLVMSGAAGCGENTAVSQAPVSTLADSRACIGCHGTAVSPVTGKIIADEWMQSWHNSEAAGKKSPGFGAGCRDCHEPQSGHPGSCSRCHGGGTPSATNVTGVDVTLNPDAAGKCFKCHHTNTLGAPHFNNLTSAGYPASYVTSRNLGKCRACHNPHDPTSARAAAHQWAQSGMGDPNEKPWKQNDNKTFGSDTPANLTYGRICVRCHTTTGYINFVTSGFTDVSAWGTSADKTKEVLACNACHDDGRGNAYGYAVRKVIADGKGITAYYNYSAVNTSGSVKINNVPTVYPDAAMSNICVVCHVGRGIGNLVKLADRAGLNFGNVSRISSHDFPGGANVFQKSGFEFYTSAARFQSNNKHNRIGIANQFNTGTKGPCISCHMSAPQAHRFVPLSSANGRIAAITSPMCANCHKLTQSGDTTWTVAKLQEKRESLAAALATLKAMEVARGLSTFNPTTQSYSYTKNWNKLYGSGIVPGSGGLHAGAYTMGASFNYGLLTADPGAFAHNPGYARRLVYDSIDWLYNGSMDLDTEAAIDWLLANARIDQATHDAAMSYLQGTR